MYTNPSRAERREILFYTEAEKGNFSKSIILYNSEIKRLKKSGFSISDIEPFDSQKKLFFVTVSWAKPYKNGIPHIVHSYIHGIVLSFPQTFVSNFAQELFIIAQKANIQKSK